MISFLKSASDSENLIFSFSSFILFQHNYLILFLWTISLSQSKHSFRQCLVSCIRSLHFQQSAFYDLSHEDAEASSEHFCIECSDCFFWATFSDKTLIISVRISSFCVRLLIVLSDFLDWLKKKFFCKLLRRKDFDFIRYNSFICTDIKFFFNWVLSMFR